MVEFDQIIDPEEIVQLIYFKASTGLFNKVQSAARLATYEEIESFKYKDNYLVSSEGRGVIFKPTKPLPNRSQVTVTVGPNVKYHICFNLIIFLVTFC